MSESFHSGLDQWRLAVHEAGLSGGDWSWSSGAVRPGRLRLWSETSKLSDYRFEFEGAIERKGMSWAFRASDGGNYYASKLVLDEKARSGKAEIVRFVVVGGKESRRVTLPIPVTLAKDTYYRIAVKVKGDRFITSVGGQVIDTWQDARLRKGGVGFFNERGEIASIRTVLVSDPDRFLEKLKSYLQFGFIMPPGI
jgi:hypothetical protein